MQRIKITHDGKDVCVVCPHCDNFEEHPINEQRHHLQHFSILDWKDDAPDHNEVSVMGCMSCGKEFELEWDYNNIEVDVVHRLEQILEKIQECTFGAWEHDLEQTTEAVAIQDHQADVDEHIEYNGWLKDLVDLMNTLKESNQK